MILSNRFLRSRREDGPPPWWLLGGVNPGIVLGVYSAKGAESYARSLVNLQKPGVNDLISVDAPVWSSERGWQFDGAKHLKTPFMIGEGCTIVGRYANAGVQGGDAEIIASYNIWEGDKGSFISLTVYSPYFGGNAYVMYGNDLSEVSVILVPGMAAGVMGVAGPRCFVNGEFIGSGDRSPETPDYMGIGISYMNGSPEVGWLKGCDVTHFAFYNGILTDEQMSLISNEVLLQ